MVAYIDENNTLHFMQYVRWGPSFIHPGLCLTDYIYSFI